MKTTPRLLVLLILTFGLVGLVSPARAALTVYPAPAGAPSNSDYSVRVRQGTGAWQNLYEYKVEVNSGHGGGGNGNGYPTTNSSMVHFDFSGTVTVEVTVNWTATINAVRIRPAAAGIPFTRSGNVITITLATPDKFSVEIDTGSGYNIYRNLHIMADPPAPAVPAGAVEFAPGFHAQPASGYFEAASNTTYYLHGGAILRGGIRVSGKSNVKIMGRGIILDDYQPVKFAGLFLANSSAITIDGIFVVKYQREPGIFGILGGEVSNATVTNVKIFSANQFGDGIDVMATSNLTIDDCFIRSSDDCVAIYASRSLGGDFVGGSHDNTIKNSTLWADVARPINIGAHGSQDPANRDIIERITATNLDILEHDVTDAFHQGCLAVRVGDENIVRHITFSDIRISDFTEGCVFSVKTFQSYVAGSVPGKSAQGIIYRNISYTGSGDAASQLDGWASDRTVNGVLFDNCTRNGALITSFASGNITPGDNYTNVTFNNQLLNPGFESDAANWFVDAGTLNIVTSPVFSGSKAARLTSRVATVNGPTQNITAAFRDFGQGSYYVRAYVRLGAGTDTARVRILVNTGGTTQEVAVKTGAVNSSGYTEISGSLNIAWSGTLNYAYFKVSTTSGTADLLVDGCVLKKN